jgi:hypothetical protein
MLNVAYSWPRAPLPFGPGVLREAAGALSANGLPVAFDDEPGGLRALVRLTDGEPATLGLVATDHPLLGRGALARLVVPRRMGRLRAAMIANALNLAESADWAGELRPNALGAWTAADVLVHSAFFPSVLFGRTKGDEVRLAIQDLLAWGAVRARFTGERLPWLEAAASSRYPDDVPADDEGGEGERPTPRS